MENTPAPDLSQTSTTVKSPDEKPPFKLGILGSVLFAVCTAQSVWLVAWQQDWSENGISRSIGVIVGTILVMFSFSVFPSWLLWRYSKKPGRGPQYLLYFLLMALTYLHAHAPQKTDDVSPEFVNNMRQGIQDGLTKVQTGHVEDSTKPLLQALDKQAGSGGTDAMVASVMAQFTREFQQCTTSLDTATKAAQAIPNPSDSDPSSYDRKITVDENALKTIQEEISFINAIPNRIDAIIKSKNFPGLASSKMLIGFKQGVTDNQALLLDYYTEMQKSYLSGVEIFGILKANQGHWHADANGHRILEDSAAQKQYDLSVAANVSANEKVAKDKTQLLDIQKQNLQKGI